jgi:hypothetical protein
MEARFSALSILTSIFQIICGITLAVGIVMILNGINGSDQSATMSSNPFAPAPADPFSQISTIMKVGGGAVLAFYGLTGLVFSGGISVLISIDQNTHSLSQDIPVVLAALQRSIATTQQTMPATVLSGDEQARKIATIATTQTEPRKCAACNSPNDANGRFCENCGEPLS